MTSPARPEPQGLLSPTDIARITNRTPGAVSNWRRRADDFPQPVAGTPTRPLFDRADIETWLNRNSIEIKPDHGETEIFAALNHLRGEIPVDTTIGLILSIAVARKLAMSTPETQAIWADLAREAPSSSILTVGETLSRSLGYEVVPSLVDIPNHVTERNSYPLIQAIDAIELPRLADVVDFVLERVARSQIKAGVENGFVGSPTSALLANLAVTRKQHGTIYDPACGIAVSLLAAHQKGATRARLVGSDISHQALQIARQRAFLRGIDIELIRTDLLREDRLPDLRADVVIAEPPYGMRWDSEQRLTDWRFQFGTPPASHSEMVWILHAITHLKEDGRAYVLTPHGPLVRDRQELDIRGKLLRHGCVEAIVGLPPKMLPHISIPLALWVLRRPMTTPAATVLFIDASKEDKPQTSVPQWLLSRRARPDSCTAEISIQTILANRAHLTPSTWVSPDRPDPEAASSQLATSVSYVVNTRALLELIDSEVPEIPTVPAPRSIPLDELISEGILELKAGRPSERYGFSSSVTNERLVGIADIGKQDLKQVPDGTDASEQIDASALTMPGDVLVSTTGQVKATVDRHGGHLPGNGVYRLRVNRPDVLLPEYLALAVTGSWNARLMTGATILRAPIRELQIPLPRQAEQDNLIQVFQSIANLRDRAEQLRDASDRVHSALVESLRTGVQLDSSTLVAAIPSGDAK